MTRDSASTRVVEGGARSLAAGAPAKINLVLEVLWRREDGYHELRSVFAGLELADELSVRVPARHHPPDEHGPDVLEVVGAPDVPVAGNLVLRAAALLRPEAVPGTGGRIHAPLVFRLRKRIPAAAGLGGGSSDALAALDLAAAAWGIRLSARRRVQLAAELGSDVPFFTMGGWALVGGRGERLRPLPPPSGGPLGVLLVVPAARLSTREVFAAWDAADRGGAAGRSHAGPAHGTAGGRHSDRTRGAVGPASTLAALLHAGASAEEIADTPPANDLLVPATVVLPGLRALRDEIAGLLGRPVHLCGSGPTLAVLYPSPGAARGPAARLRAALRRGALPAPGGCAAIIVTATAGKPAGGKA